MTKVERKFKVGDKVRIISMPNQTRVVIALRGDDKIDIRSPDGNVYLGMYEHQYELYNTPAEDAIALLVKEGYTVTPPKPKRTGKIAVYSYSDGVNIIPKEYWDAWSTKDQEKCPLIATLDWTEGDGL